MSLLAKLFVLLTAFWAGFSVWLSLRQSRHVARFRAEVPASFAAEITPADHDKAADYALARERLARAATIVEALVAIGWVAGGIDLLWAGLAFVHQPLVRDVAFLICTGLVSAVIDLPFALYRTFGVEQRFGFNKTNLRTFVADRAKSGLIALLIAVPLLTGLLIVMRLFRGAWWLWAWAGLLILMLAAPSIFVRFIAPRFNRFTPLADEALRAQIESLCARAGYTASALFTMDASRRTAHGNAYFIGFGRTKRIVLFDTLLERCASGEIQAVVAHELGHFRHKHVLFALVRSAVLTFVVFAAFGWLAKQDWLLPAFGVKASSPALSLYVCMLLGSLLGPLGAIASNWVSRRNEFQADAFASRMVGAAPMISALTKLAKDNLSTLTSDPYYALVHYSHPSVPVRVRQLRALASEAA